MDDNRPYSKLKKEKDYCVAVMALSTALTIFLVMLTVRAMTGNHMLTLAGGAITFCVILIVMAALKAQQNSILMQLVRVPTRNHNIVAPGEADIPVPAKQTYDASGKIPSPPRLSPRFGEAGGEAGTPDKGQHTDLQS